MKRHAAPVSCLRHKAATTKGAAMTASKWRRAADTVLFVGVAVAFIYPGLRTFRPKPAVTDDGVPDLIQPGVTLALPDLQLAEEERNAVLFLNTWCPACNAGKSFYRKMTAATASRFVVVSDEPPVDVRRWLAESGIVASQVLANPDVPSLYSLGVIATPTLLAVDERGVVLDAVVGRLSSAQEIAFLSFLGGTSDEPVGNLRDPPVIGNEEMTRIARAANVQVLDVRDRAAYEAGHHDGAVNIPWDELAVRARVELSANEPLVVDCSVDSWRECRTAARSLHMAGFRQVSVLSPDGTGK